MAYEPLSGEDGDSLVEVWYFRPSFSAPVPRDIDIPPLPGLTSVDSRFTFGFFRLCSLYAG